MELQNSIGMIKGIGEKTEKLFAKMNVFTVGELLEHYPRAYDSYEEIIPVSEAKVGQVATVEVSLVAALQVKKVRNLTILTGRARDYSGDIMLTWFNMPFLKNTVKMGTHYILRGMVARKNNTLVLEQPKILTKEEYVNKLHALQPVYPLTFGLTNHAVTKAIAKVLKEVDLTGDYLPLEIRKQYKLIDYKTAIREIHFPKSMETVIEARRRIVFDEFFLFDLAMSQIKSEKRKKSSLYKMELKKECEILIANLSYSLTNAQKKVWQEIKQDMISGTVANRLIQGDVGSGKTIIAALALLLAAKNDYEGAIMVPTEVLAKQHFENLDEVLSPFGVKCELLVGSMTVREKREAYKRIKNHEVDVIIGTHTLIQEKVEYDKLALVITDEQHRFGVRQRESLMNKGGEPHVLVMSATPIPRTLAIILYGDLDLSVIDELPSNRLPIKNCVVNDNYRPTAYRFLEKEIGNGRQAYIICPMVEESETMEAENVIDYTEKLKANLPSYIQIEYLHGKMKAKEKNNIMERFSKGEIHIIVSTTVVEVGVNVPNATVMMIENAERFGLAQLHQLRGRVGRGEHQSYCILISNTENKETRQRLEVLNQSDDGFYIAREDLKSRGPGDLFGIRQSGMLEFKMADVFNDAVILQEANEAVKMITGDEVKWMLKKYEGLRRKLAVYAEDLYL